MHYKKKGTKNTDMKSARHSCKNNLQNHDFRSNHIWFSIPFCYMSEDVNYRAGLPWLGKFNVLLRAEQLSLFAALILHTCIPKLEGSEHFSLVSKQSTSGNATKAQLQLWNKFHTSNWGSQISVRDKKGQTASVTGRTFLVQCEWSEKPQENKIRWHPLFLQI